jgi:hypothetical protein
MLPIEAEECMRRIGLSLFCAMALGACAGSGGYTVTGSIQSPELAYVGPGVYAVADSDQPVFFADNFYWRFDSGRWYRSERFNGDWVTYNAPPQAVLSIHEPYAYVHYHPNRLVRRDQIPQQQQRQYPQPQPDYDRDRVDQNRTYDQNRNDRDRDQNINRDNDRDRDQNINRNNDRDRDQNMNRDRDRDKDRDQNVNRDKDRDQNINRDKDKDRDDRNRRDKDKDKDPDRDN